MTEDGMTSAILLNVRGKAGGQLVHKDDHGQSWLEITLKKGNDLDLYVVDGHLHIARPLHRR